MNKYIFKMECITNMHVGSGEENYNIIDNEVQKDVVLTDVPAIHSSGVKGALREHFVNKTDILSADIIKHIFGNDKGETTSGHYKFFGAKLIARPLRVSSGDRPYLLTTSNDILEDFSALLNGLGMSDYFAFSKYVIPKDKFVGTVDKIELEGVEVLKIEGQGKTDIANLIGPDYALAESLRAYDLPVIARNKLDGNGKSENLWYEEIVPHKSIFFFVIMTPKKEKMALNFENETIQFGGNASIGQGYTKITKVYSQEEDA